MSYRMRSGEGEKVRCSAAPAFAVANKMGAHTYEEDPVTSPLGGVEPGLTLGTIEEAKEGSTGDESETETIAEPPQDETAEVTQRAEEKEELEEQEDEEEKEEELDACLWEDHPDVDGGWAWAILIAMFGVFVITSGLLSTTGMFYVQMLEEYGHSRSYTAWMGSLINAFFMLGGPVSFMFIQTFGCRAALICGSIIMATGYIVSAFTTSLEALFFTYGVVVGKRADTEARPVTTQDGSPAFPFLPQLRNVIAHFILSVWPHMYYTCGIGMILTHTMMLYHPRDFFPFLFDSGV